MASEPPLSTHDETMTTAELVAFTQRELDAEAKRQAQVAAESNGEVLQSSQTGATLDYSKKNIHELPVEVVALFKDKVERLALSHNPQIAIPREIVQCDRLRYLNVRANRLVEFPQHILLLSQLEILDLSKNDITTIPEGIKAMSSLKFLAVVRNKITRLPLALGEMPNLHKLKFEENPIEFPTLDELQLPEDRNGHSMQEMDKDREMCQQVKRVLKSKALRQRLLRTPTEDEASESNAETPRPLRRTATGRFPVKPSVSKIDISEIIRSTSNSPPDVQLTARHIMSTPTKNGAVPATTTGSLYSASRNRSESASTTASIRARRQGYVPSKRSNDLGSVSEIAANSTRSSNASTIKGTHAYKASNSSTLSGIGSSSGAENSSGPASPVGGVHGDFKLLAANRRHIDHPPHPTKVQRSPAMHAARRLHFSLYQLHCPLRQIAIGLFNGQSHNKTSNLRRHFLSASALTERLDNELGLLDGRAITGMKEVELKRRIMFLVQSALKSFSTVMECMQTYVQRIGFVLNPLHTRCLMHQLYATVVEARNVLQLLDVPVRYTSVMTRDTPRASRMPEMQSHRPLTPSDARPGVTNRRLRGATILRNEISVDALRVIPPAKSVDGSRSNTMTSSTSATTPVSAENFPMAQSAVLPSRNNMLLNHSSDEHDDNSEQFEAIFLKLQEACDIASKALPSCLHEVTLSIDSATRDGNRAAGRLWQSAAKSYHKIAKAYHELADRLGAVRLKDPGVRTQKEFWQLCDTFVQTWTEFALSIKKLSQEGFDISAVRSLMKPMQRIVKDLSKTISDSPLYHQAVRGTVIEHRAMGPPFPLSLNTMQAQAVSHLGSNPPSAAPSSTMTVSVPATPLTAALGPAAQATLTSTPGSAVTGPDYFSTVGKQLNSTRSAHDGFPPVNIATAPQIALPALPGSVAGVIGNGRR